MHIEGAPTYTDAEGFTVSLWFKNTTRKQKRNVSEFVNGKLLL
jgi:hypothetical protein